MRAKIIAVYSIVNKYDGKIYIGGTIDLYRRWWQHKNLLSHGIHKSIYFQEAYDEYGADAFVYSIIEILPDSTNLLEREQYWYDYYQPYKRENGYNVNINAKDGTGKKSRPESVLKMRNSLSIVLKGINKGDKNGNYKFPDELVKKAFNLMLSGYSFDYICKKLPFQKDYLTQLRNGRRRQYIYREYVLPKLKDGETLTSIMDKSTKNKNK